MADATSSAWAMLLGGGGVSLLVAIGGGFKYLLSWRREGQSAVEAHRREVLTDYKQIAAEAEERYRRLDAEMQAAKAAWAKERRELEDEWEDEREGLKREIARQQRWSLYHLALSDWWHGRARLLYHTATNVEQRRLALKSYLRGFVLRHPDEVRPDLLEKMETPDPELIDPPPFLSPNEHLIKSRPKEADEE